MNQDSAESSEDSIVEYFFNSLKIEHQYYSTLLKQPILLIGEKSLYKAVKETIEKTNNINNSNNKKTETINAKPAETTIKTNNKFKPLPSFNFP